MSAASRLFWVSLALLALSASALGAHDATPPPDPVTVSLGSRTYTLWPYTSTDLSSPSDPVNLVILNADPREVRQALLALNGDRTAFGFPAVSPFDCTWSDTMGYEQATWTEAVGWAGSDIQLSCGQQTLGPIRFHLRLYRHGDVTLGAAHFEVQIPKTAEHETLSWEFAERFVTMDLARSGALTAPPSLVALTAPGALGVTRQQIYNALLAVPSMVPLLAMLGLPTTPQTAPLPIATDGVATVLAANVAFTPGHERTRRELTVNYDIVSPKPFCASGPLDLVRLEGPLQLALTVRTTPSGQFSRTYTVEGILNVTPIDPATGLPRGPSVKAIIAEAHRALLTDKRSEVKEVGSQVLLGAPPQAKAWSLRAGAVTGYVTQVLCEPSER
jgi:hypothetical protein